MKRLRVGTSRRRAIASIEVDRTARRGSSAGRVAGWQSWRPPTTQHKQGRVALVVREALQTAETAFRRGARDAKVKAQVDAILKLCKREPRAKAAVLDSNATRWLEAFAEGRGDPWSALSARRDAAADTTPPWRAQ